jgi:hypothetical protein
VITRPEAPRRLLADSPVEDELDVVGPAEVQVFPNHLVEEDPARHGAVQYLRQTELGLEDRELIAVTGPAVTDGKRVRQARQPLAPQGLDPRGREPVAQRLEQPGLRAADNAVVQRLVGDAPLGELALDVLVPIETELGGVREVRAELQEEGAEVSIDAIEVVVVHHRRGPHQPGIRLAGLGIPTPLGREDRGLLLCLADEEDALVPGEPGQVLGHHLVLPLAFLEGDQRERVLDHEGLDGRHEGLAHRSHEGRRRKQVAAMRPEEPRHAALGLQPWYVYVEVHPVDALHFQRYVLAQNLRHRAW